MTNKSKCVAVELSKTKMNVCDVDQEPTSFKFSS